MNTVRKRLTITKTVLDFDEMDVGEEEFDRRIANWSRPEATRFGTWHDWSEEDINYLLTELRDGHWEDCGENLHGFALANAGLDIAVTANETGPGGNKLARVLERIAMGMGWFLDLHDGEYLDCTEEVFEAACKAVKAIENGIYEDGLNPFARRYRDTMLRLSQQEPQQELSAGSTS